MSQENRACVYRLLDNSIHEFTFIEATRKGVDELFEHIDTISHANQSGLPQLHLMDCVQTGMLPTRLLVSRTQVWLQQRKGKVPPMCTAVLIQDNSMIHMVMGILAPLLRNREIKTRFFKATQREEAITWLMLERDKSSRV